MSQAPYDAQNPDRNIIGIPKNTKEAKAAAQAVLDSLPDSPYSKITTSREAEFIKYSRNCNGFVRIVFINLLHDLAQAHDVSWDAIHEAMAHDPYMSGALGGYYHNPVHKNGRGAGGECFIKDFEAFKNQYKEHVQDDQEGIHVLEALIEKNKSLLINSNKDLHLLRGVYGEDVVK